MMFTPVALEIRYSPEGSRPIPMLVAYNNELTPCCLNSITSSMAVATSNNWALSSFEAP